MNYIIVEMQTNGGTTAVPTSVKSTYETAEQEYHTKCAYAAVSNVPVHAVSMITENGVPVEKKHECYKHGQPTPETEG